MFSILIPTFNNVKYLELCINSIKKNSKYDHQIVVHVNIGDDGTIEYLNKKLILNILTPNITLEFLRE